MTVIATGFDRSGVRAAREERVRRPRDRAPRIDERQRDSVVIHGIPAFLR